MTLNVTPILHAVPEDYALPWDGHHDIAHWARVLENGGARCLAPEAGATISAGVGRRSPGIGRVPPGRFAAERCLGHSPHPWPAIPDPAPSARRILATQGPRG